ncbi:hypothetical protein CC1G_11042 [Coprinopsis cinerea okayama7|uniref:RRM domain-containing protein n=1 Tax=Coprinopsis cinerea (strain Okayama-7 / 130 / ATCC MYA-4618 / FGSC 9003) TaxID=240176 RepID=A8NIU1_COPC7|nr:hypothetical protein CC1G_11042 [Coprinopsis cinerea okayama7\|eukprot:XP_001834072.1 hypothetical protein CC1G_11042 [Coprinopsis cinerea okayama7\
MAFRLSQKAFGQLLRSQSRSITTSVTGRALARSAVTTSACSRSTLVKAFSTSRMCMNAQQNAVETSNDASKRQQQRQLSTDTVFFSNLPFFTDQKGFEQLLAEFGPVSNINWTTSPKSKAPWCFVTFKSPQDAATLVESSKQEPFYFGGRNLGVQFAHARADPKARTGGGPVFPPSNQVYFRHFRGDLNDLKTFLGEHANGVNFAYFGVDRQTNTQRDSGVIRFASVEQAQAVINELRGKRGPDGMAVFLRFASDTNPQAEQMRQESQQSGAETPQAA